ncbi:uncharacterized protein J7T54_000163 [Emericellopsis cladophorae]|uniref:Mitochondrial adapter protein MCP1 transmembrane domain-containing protein n=1 Tax=Emericellopsis cladophorae TaxID=2686198 RepID=A0A9P9XZ18_9HYPO|nr:uncharacterized protein J7T54_000163 [Emericellopsis cladophorae]KAI6780523.1 hypothetical protein J7T54_000163 [Emericellopsis cladophorae]
MSDRRDSLSTNVSLLQLDPSPIDSPEVERPVPLLEDESSEDLESSSASLPSKGSASAPGLSGSGRGSIYYLTRVQKYSSYAMNTFFALHITNVSILPAITGSADASETYLLMTREIYQTAITEPLLVALPAILHIGSGIALRLVRRSQNVQRYGTTTPGFWAVGSHRKRMSPWPEMSYISLSGYALSFFYSAHVLVNRILPLAVEGDSSNIGLAYVAHGFARSPWISGIGYAGLIGLSAGHIVWGSAKWLNLAPSTRGWLQRRNGIEASAVVDKKTRKERRRKWLAVQGVAALVAGLWAVGGLGVVARAGASDGWIGKLYDGMFMRIGV